jgi:hypothetical protein
MHMQKQSRVLQLNYVIETGPGGIPADDDLRKVLDEVWGGPVPVHARVSFSDTRLSIDCGKPALFSLDENLASGDMLLVDHRTRQYTRLLRRQQRGTAAQQSKAKLFGTSEAKLEGVAIPLQHFFL